MGQQQPFSAADGTMWLSSLVETFERTEQLHREPCDRAVVSAAIERLKRPAGARRQVVRKAEMFEFLV